jgi:hypothetical protein
MQVELQWPDLARVIATADHKGTPLTVLLVGDEEVLYAYGHEPGGLEPRHWEDVFRTRLGRIFADLLLGGPEIRDDREQQDGEPVWHRESPTGRETWGRDSSDHVVRLVPEPEAGP